MIQLVYEQVKKASMFDEIYVATDSLEIHSAVNQFGGSIIPTLNNCRNGTERCAMAVDMLRHADIIPDIIINVQADLPFITPEHLYALILAFLNPDVYIATLITRIYTSQVRQDSNVVKVTLKDDWFATDFSRGGASYYKHIGVYGYRRDTLLNIASEKVVDREVYEALEQLRWLEHGYEIKCINYGYDTQSIDSPNDIKE